MKEKQKNGEACRTLRVRVPYYYRNFACIGGSCEDHCCGGWNIAIDDESLKRYKHVPGAFGLRLLNEISWTGKCFTQKHRTCSFLNEDGLCDIYRELGKDSLCETCRTYPRHTEDYGDLNEEMLSLSCPEAARQILRDPYQCAFEEKAVTCKGELSAAELHPDAPWADLAWLEETRHTMICLIRNREISWEQRLAMVTAFAHDLQKHWYEVTEEVEESHQAFRMRRVTKKLTKRYLDPKAAARFAEKIAPYEANEFERLIRTAAWMREAEELLPVLDHWIDRQAKACTILYNRMDSRTAMEKRKEFRGEALSLEQSFENLVLYFLQTYALGALYDGDLYAKVQLVMFSYVIIREWCFARYCVTGRLTQEDLEKAAYRYSREVENSDENLNDLEERFTISPLFTLRSMLTVLCG